MFRLSYFARALTLLLFCSQLCHALETSFRLENSTSPQALFKIEQVKKILVLRDGTRLTETVRDVEGPSFLGAFGATKKPVSVARIDRSAAWERVIYRITPQKKSAGFPIDILIETGNGWSFMLVKSGGQWANEYTRNPASVVGTDLWIKAGATALTVDSPERAQMQIGPRTTCAVRCVIEGLEQHYVLTIADNGSPEVYAARFQRPDMNTVILENATEQDWHVTVDGAAPKKSYLSLDAGSLERAFEFQKNIGARRLPKDRVVLSFIPPRGTPLKSFYMVFSQLNDNQEPTVLVGPTPYRVSANLYVPGVFIKISKKGSELRYTLTNDAALELKEALSKALKAHRSGSLSVSALKSEIDTILAKAPEALKRSPIKFTLPEFKSLIINSLDSEEMAPVLWFGNNNDMVNFLAERGANLAISDKQLLYYAIGSGDQAVITNLLARGLLPEVRHIVFAQSVDRAIAVMLVTDLIGRIVSEKNSSYLDTLEGAVAAVLKAGNTDFAYWMANTLRDTIARKGPENLLARSTALVDKTTAACPEKATIELQLQRDDLPTGIYSQQSHKSEQVPYHGTSSYITIDTIGKLAHHNVSRDYSLFFHGMHVATINFVFAPDGSLSATVSSGETGSTVAPTSPGHYHLEFGDKEADLVILSVKEGGQTKGKIYIERGLSCTARAGIELISQRPEFAVWAEQLTAAGGRAGITTGLEKDGSKMVDTFCLPGRAARERYYKIFIFKEPIAIIKCIFFADGTTTAQIRSTDFDTVLQNTSNKEQGWDLAGNIGRGIRVPFTIPGNVGSLTVEAINSAQQPLCKIWIQVAGLPVR